MFCTISCSSEQLLICQSGVKSHLGLMTTICLPSLSSTGMTNCLPVASEAMLSHVISWGLYVRRLLNRSTVEFVLCNL